jgi:AcrR family transcriptional regulator
MYMKGVAATTLDEILASAATSTSQFYQHFADKSELVRAVISLRGEEILSRQRLRLEKLNSFRGLEQWRDALVQRSALRRGAWGCELGSLASELADTDEAARVALTGHFQAWQQLLADGFERMRDNGVLRDDVEASTLATAVMAAVQGGYLLAQTAHDSRPMEVALDMALACVRSFQPTDIQP